MARGTDQCGGETSSAGMANENGNSTRPMRLPRGRQTPKICADGPKSSRLAASVNPESSSLARRLNVCDFGVPVDNSGQSEYKERCYSIRCIYILTIYILTKYDDRLT